MVRFVLLEEEMVTSRIFLDCSIDQSSPYSVGWEGCRAWILNEDRCLGRNSRVACGALPKQCLTIPIADNDVNRFCAQSTATVNGTKLSQAAPNQLQVEKKWALDTQGFTLNLLPLRTLIADQAVVRLSCDSQAGRGHEANKEMLESQLEK